MYICIHASSVSQSLSLLRHLEASATTSVLSCVWAWGLTRPPLAVDFLLSHCFPVIQWCGNFVIYTCLNFTCVYLFKCVLMMRLKSIISELLPSLICAVLWLHGFLHFCLETIFHPRTAFWYQPFFTVLVWVHAVHFPPPGPVSDLSPGCSSAWLPPPQPERAEVLPPRQVARLHRHRASLSIPEDLLDE